jgi:hypothetical protein
MQLPEKKGLVSGPEIVSRTAVRSNLQSMRIARPALLLVLAVSGPIQLETPAEAAKRYSCSTCPVRGIDPRASTPLGTAAEASGCRVRNGVAGLPVPDPDCTPGAINQTVTADIIKSGRFRTGCVRNCITTTFQKDTTYDRYGIQKRRATSLIIWCLWSLAARTR